MISKKVRSSHDKNRLPSGDFKGVLFAGKQRGFRPVLSENKGGGSALSLFYYLRYGSSSFMQKSVILLCLTCISVHFGNIDLHAFCQTYVTCSVCCLLTFTNCRTMVLTLCQYHLLGSEQKGVLVDCNPTHLSPKSGACLFGSDDTMTSFVLARLADGSRV